MSDSEDYDDSYMDSEGNDDSYDYENAEDTEDELCSDDECIDSSYISDIESSCDSESETDSLHSAHEEQPSQLKTVSVIKKEIVSVRVKLVNSSVSKITKDGSSKP